MKLRFSRWEERYSDCRTGSLRLETVAIFYGERSKRILSYRRHFTTEDWRFCIRIITTIGFFFFVKFRSCAENKFQFVQVNGTRMKNWLTKDRISVIVSENICVETFPVETAAL